MSMGGYPGAGAKNCLEIGRISEVVAESSNILILYRWNAVGGYERWPSAVRQV